MYLSDSQNGWLMQPEEYFPGTSMRANDGMSHEGTRGAEVEINPRGARRRNTTSAVVKRLLVVLSRELSTTGEREASRVIKNIEESEKSKNAKR